MRGKAHTGGGKSRIESTFGDFRGRGRRGRGQGASAIWRGQFDELLTSGAEGKSTLVVMVTKRWTFFSTFQFRMCFFSFSRHDNLTFFPAIFFLLGGRGENDCVFLL